MTLPKTDFSNFQIPEHQLEFRTARSQGSGGQNVNKVESKVELRFHLPSAYWIPAEVRHRMHAKFRSKLTLEDELIISSQRTASQHQNREDCLHKLREYIESCWRAPKVRKPSKPTRSSREKRLKSKKSVGQKKSQRKVSWSD